MNIFRVILGRKHMYLDDCLKNNYIGVDYGMNIDLSNELVENWRDFNKKFIPVYISKFPESSKISAGLACGAIHTLAKGLQDGDCILSPDGKGKYHVGEVSGQYNYVESSEKQFLRHRRSINWSGKKINREEMSSSLQGSTGSIATLCNMTKYMEEIQNLIGDTKSQSIMSKDSEIESPSEFVMEEHLETFLEKNWSQTELSKKYDIYQDGEFSGRQFRTDTGPIDILAVSKCGKELLVIELKKGKASDRVVGQIQRYMGYIKDEVAEEGQTVKGVIIAFGDDTSIKRALSVTNNIDFYSYEIFFTLKKIK